jgi:hypothetical protein
MCAAAERPHAATQSAAEACYRFSFFILFFTPSIFCAAAAAVTTDAIFSTRLLRYAAASFLISAAAAARRRLFALSRISRCSPMLLPKPVYFSIQLGDISATAIASIRRLPPSFRLLPFAVECSMFAEASPAEEDAVFRSFIATAFSFSPTNSHFDTAFAISPAFAAADAAAVSLISRFRFSFD